MNTDHAELCNSPEWASFIADEVLPTVLRDQVLGADLLEIGPGYGASTKRLLAEGRTLTAVEIDAALAARLRGLYPAARVIEGSGDDLPFPDRSFSAVLCFTMLHHVHSARAQDSLFAEARRVLRPGGLFAGSDSIASPGLRAFHHGDVYTPVDPGTLAARLDSAGFDDVTISIAPEDEWFAFSARAAQP